MINGVTCYMEHPADTNLIIAGYQDGCIQIWNVMQMSLISHHKEHDAEITFIGIHPRFPDKFLTGSKDGYIKIWDLQTMTVIGSLQ